MLIKLSALKSGSVHPFRRSIYKMLLFVLCLTFCAFDTNAQTPTLGVYANTTVIAGQNTTVSPSAAPTNTTSIVGYTNTNFTGVISVNPATGVVTVTDAKQAGTYTVTIKA